MGRSSRSPTREHHHHHHTQRSRSAHSLNRAHQQELRPYVESRTPTPSRPGSRPGTYGTAQGKVVQEHLARSQAKDSNKDEKAFSSFDGNWIAVNEAKVKSEMSAKNSLAVRNEAKAKQMAASMREELRREREANKPPPSPASSGYSTSQGRSMSSSSGPSRIITTPSGMVRAQSPGGSNIPNGGVVYRYLEPSGPQTRIIYRGVSPQQQQHVGRPMVVHHRQGSPAGRIVVHQPQMVMTRSRPTSPQYRIVSPSHHKVAPAHAMAIARAQSPGYGMSLHRQPSPHQRQGPVVVQRAYSSPQQVVYVSDSRHQGYVNTPQGRYERSRRGSASSSSSGSKYRNPLLREKPPQPEGAYAIGGRNRSSSVPDIFFELNSEENFFPQTLPRNFGAQRSAAPQAYHSSTVPRPNKKGVVYRGEFVKVAVPRYKVQEDKTWVANNNRNSLLISKTYHSEPDLLGAQDDDGDITMRLSLLPPEEQDQPLSPPPGQLRLQVLPQDRQQHGFPVQSQSNAPRTPQTPGTTYFNTPDTPRTPGTPSVPGTPHMTRSPVSPLSLSSTQWEYAPRTVVLQKGRSGFGFVLRGAKAQMSQTQALEFTPTADFPALQYLDRVDKSSMADRAGLKPGDFLLEINGESVVNATHEHTVRLIKHSGDTLAMKVITVRPMVREGLETRDIHADGTMTLPLKKKDKSDLSRQRHRDADTHSLTHGQGGNYHREAPEPIMIPPTVSRKLDNQNKTASIRSRTSASRLTSVELDDLFARQPSVDGAPVSPHGRNMANGNVVVPVQNRPTARSQQQQAQMSRARSQPDLDRGQPQNRHHQEGTYAKHITRVDIGEQSAPSPNNRLSFQEDQFEYPDHRYSNGSAKRDNIYATPVIEPEPKPTFNYARSGVHLPLPSSVIPPPPTVPAPEPPSPTSSEMIEITPAYANVSNHIQMREKSFTETKDESPYESSFRPGRNARLSKAPVDLPVNRSRHSSNYSGSGSGSGSDHSETRQTYSPHKHVMAYEKHSASSESGSDKQSVTFAEDKVYENAARFVQDHPQATVLMTNDGRNSRQSSTSAQSGKTGYYEPTPDYDQEETDTVKRRPPSHDKPASRPESTGSAKIETEVPPVRSLREQWQKRDGTSPGRSIAAAAAYSASEKHNSPGTAQASTPPHVTQRQSSLTQKSPTRPQSKPPPPPSPAKEEQSMSAFGNAIREAAVAREKRAKEQEEIEAVKQKEKEEKQRKDAAEAERKAEEAKREAERARQEAERKRLEQEEAKKRQTPVAPAPPPPAVVAAAPIEIKKSQTPPANVQKKLEENRKREEGHNQLMAAIAKRRNLIDNAAPDNSAAASDIDARIERNKSVSPGRALKADQQNIELVKETTPPKAIGPIPTPAASTTSSRRSSLKREAPQPPGAGKPPAPAVPSLDSLPKEQDSEQEARDSSAETDVDNFTARAERARLEWLKKKQAGTATLEKSKKTEEPKKSTDDEDNNNVAKDKQEEEEEEKKPPKAPEFVRPSRTLPRDPKPPSSAERAVSPSGGGLGDLASIIAQKALQRQKTYEGDIEKEAGGPRGTHIVYGSQRSENTNLSNANSVSEGQNNIFQRFSRTQSGRSLEITGATLDSSNTEPVMPGQDGNKSVLERSKMFETQSSAPAKNGNSYSVKSVTRTSNSNNNGNGSIPPSTDLPFDLPPPLVVGHNKYSASSYDRITRKGSDSDVVTNRSSMNGDETVGWVINSSPPQHSHEFAMRRKLANRNGSHASGVDIGGADDIAQMALVDQHVSPALADIVEVEVIPPPPLFDTDSDALGSGLGVMSPSNFQPAFSHEDNASMVSSLSTLSTLSSNEHDNQFAHDSGYQSHIQTQFSSPSSGYHSTSISQSEDLYSELAPPSEFEVAPPPPGFDDCSTVAPMGYVELQQENHYEELSTIQEFIPPPCEFDAAPRGEATTSLRRNVLQRSSLRHHFEEKDITDWSVDDVADWLDSLNLSSHKQTFRRHQVTGQNLTQMGRNELIALGVTQVGDRMNIERAVKRALISR